MKLTIDGELQTLIPIAEFRQAHNLPPDFGAALFVAEPATHSQIWQTRTAELAHIQNRLPTLMPHAITLANITTMPQTMALLLHGELLALGVDSDLTRDEVEFTADECRNVLEAVAYKLVQLSYTHGHDKAAVTRAFEMPAIYQEVLDSSVLVSEEVHRYAHEGEAWPIQLIYGGNNPLGLAITTSDGQTHYVADDQLAFPGLQFIATLSVTLGQKMCEVFSGR